MGTTRTRPASAGWMILIGDGMHNFTDGILIAAAFLANPQLGIVTGVAIIAHEIPQEIGDFIVLLNAGFSRARAYVYNLLCSLMAVVGGLLGYFTLDKASGLDSLRAGVRLVGLHLHRGERPDAADAAPRHACAKRFRRCC